MKPIKQLLEENHIPYQDIEPVTDEVFAGVFGIQTVKGYRLTLHAMQRTVSIQCGVGTYSQTGRHSNYFKFDGTEIVNPPQPAQQPPANYFEVSPNCEIATWLPDTGMQVINGDTVEGYVSEAELVAFLKRITDLDDDARATGDDLSALMTGVFDD